MEESTAFCNARPTSLRRTAKSVPLQLHGRLTKAAPTPLELDFKSNGDIEGFNQTLGNLMNTLRCDAILENVKSNGDIEGFNQTLGNLMNTLSAKAPFTVNRFATGSSVVNSSVAIYGLGMCLRSLSCPDCGTSCLSQAIADMNSCCSSQVGAQVYLGSCTVRF